MVVSLGVICGSGDGRGGGGGVVEEVIRVVYEVVVL